MDWYGLSRVVGEQGVLPQRAQVLDPSLPIRPGEMVIDVEALNIDAASFKQLKDEARGNAQAIGEEVLRIVRSRGKMHNPVTGSGGMLIGRVREISREHPAIGKVAPGDRIATLVSLTLTPLSIATVRAVHQSVDRVDVDGHAILFPSGIYARLPGDIPDTAALAALDVCGAPALVSRYVRPGMNVLVIGAGKSGTLSLAQARKSLGGQGRLLAADVSPHAIDSLKTLNLCDAGFAVDATNAVRVLELVTEATGGALCDVVINCASVPGTEMSAILATRSRGNVIFFSMATSFTAAALGAEGVGKDITMIVGNGYSEGHADLTLELLRTTPPLRALFESRYG